MSIASINKFFKVVKDSGKGALERNAKRMDEVRDEFDEVCHKNGIDPDAAWVQTASFVAYGFNRNHATGYGIRSYRTAYLKAYYPLEYMTALLQSWAGRDKEKVYIREARRMEIPILPPDINNPSGTWAMDKRRGAIRRGLVSIAGIGMKVADEIATRAPFNDMDDFCQRCNGHIVTGAKHWREGNPDIALNTGVIKKLHEARVLDPLLK
jgi:DNA polymerase-3 subunit alpha